MRKYLNLRSNIALGLILAFFFNSLGPIPTAKAEPIYSVEGEFHLPAPGILVHLSPEFNPPILKGIKVHPENPFQFEFILDQGDDYNRHPERSKGSQQEQLKTQATKLIKYFLASLTIPDNDLWVNLSPYEKNRIIPPSFGLTEMGRDLLAEDYMLKQITASLIYPEDEIGKKFWKLIYEKAYKKFGTTNIPVNTFNKVWIVPEKAVVYENAQAGTAYVVESKLKVMLEQDYLALSHSVIASEAKQSFKQIATSALGSQIVREIVIPELTKEINENKNFAQLRQVYNSLILATWYKKKIKDSILAQVYEDRKKVAGVGYANNLNIEDIYQRYLQAFKKGVYNYIKEEQDPITEQVMPRKYFSGGEALMKVPLDLAMSSDPMVKAALDDQTGSEVIVKTDLTAAGQKKMKTIDGAMNAGSFPEVLENLRQYFGDHEFKVLKVDHSSGEAQYSAERVRLDGSRIYVRDEPIAELITSGPGAVHLQAVGSFFDLSELEYDLRRILPQWGWNMGHINTKDYRDRNGIDDREDRHAVLVNILGDDSPRAHDSIDWIFRIKEEDFLDPGELFVDMSKYKLGDSEVVSYFSGLLAEQIRNTYGDQFLHHSDNWVIVTASVYKKYNSAVFELAEAVSQKLGIQHQTFRSKTGKKDKINWKGSYSSVNNLADREQRLIEENKDLELEGDQDSLKGKEIIYLDDVLNSGLILKHAWKLMVSKYHVGPVHMFALARLLAQNPSIEAEFTRWAFKNKRWNSLLSIINSSLDGKDNPKKIRFVRNLFKEPTIMDFKSFLAFLSTKQLREVYNVAHASPLEIPGEQERMSYLKEIIAKKAQSEIEAVVSLGKSYKIDEKGFLIGRIYDPEFIKSERELSSKHKTIVFDRDNTLGYYDREKDQFVLREGIVEELKKLKEMGYRLVLWTRANRDFVDKGPQELLDCFDLKITMENFAYGSESERRTAYDSIGANSDQILDIYRELGMPFKDTTLLNYGLIVDDKTFEQQMTQHSSFKDYHYYKISRIDRNSPGQEDMDHLADKIHSLYEQEVNRAMAAHALSGDLNGGIDLTPARMKVQTQNNDGEIKFHMDAAMLAQHQNAPGFVPVITSIQPMTDLRQFLTNSPKF